MCYLMMSNAWHAADLRTLAKLIPAESRLVIEPPKKADEPQKALEVVGVPTSSIRQGDVLRVLPGERVPVDGEILEGRCSLDESMLTGESALINKAEGAQASAQASSSFPEDAGAMTEKQAVQR